MMMNIMVTVEPHFPADLVRCGRFLKRRVVYVRA